jgi:hypothetical protein
MEPIPVTFIREADEFTPVFGAWQTYSLLGVAAETTQQVQLLPADTRRRKAWIAVNSAPVETTTEFEGSAAAPAANGNVVLVSASSLPPPGVYQVNWRVGLDGTVSAADLNNFKLVFGSLLLNGVNNPVVGDYPQPPVTITIPVGNVSTLSVKAIGAATVGSTYSAQITLTPLTVFNGFISVGTLGQVQNGQGGRIYAGQKWEIRAHSLLYFAGDGSTPLSVVVNVERDQEP